MTIKYTMYNLNYAGIKKLGARRQRIVDALEFTMQHGPRAESHNINHHIRVVNKAIQAFECIESKLIGFINNVLVVCAIHDCVDYKYPKIKEKNIELVREKFGENILEVVTHMSWTNNIELDDEYWDHVKQFAQQADWWDAIDLFRCIKYTKEKHESRDDVIFYYNIKLKHILNELDEPFYTLALNDHNIMVKDYNKFVVENLNN